MLERNSIYYDISFSTQNLTPAIAGEISCGGFLLHETGINKVTIWLQSFGIEQSNIPLTYIYTEYTPSDEELYVKMNSSWVQVQTAYKKINGNWVEQSDLTNVFQSGVNYVKGN